MSNASYTFPSVAINNMTFTATRWGQFPTITYVNGATAGSEVVTVDSSFNITVQIQSGVSTNLQIKTAIVATAGSLNGLSAGDLVSIVITGGHNSDTNLAVKNAFLVGGVAATKASATIGGLKFTAATAGTAGNSITVLFVTSVAFTVTTVTDGTHLVISSAAGLFVGQTIKQGTHATTITTITDATHIVVGSTTSWTGAGAAASSPAVAAGSELAGVGVSATTVVVQMADQASTVAQIIAAVAANAGVTALVVATSLGTSAAQYKVAANPAVTLTGGLAAASAAVVLQDLTYTAAATGVAGNLITVTYTTGATAGAEVVTVVGNAITIQIQSGVSTATQIHTAFNASSPATTLATNTVSGTGATAQVTTNASPMTGSVGAQALSFYLDQSITALTASYVYFPFKGNCIQLHIINDETTGAKAPVYSFDGVNEAGQVAATQVVSIQNPNKGGIYLKFASAAPAYRVMAVLY